MNMPTNKLLQLPVLWHRLQAWIDATAMYTLVIYMLLVLVASSLVGSLVGLVAYGFVSQIISVGVVALSAYLTSIVLAKISGVTANHHSSLITGLILFFLITPGEFFLDHIVLAGTVVVAVVSKYVFVYRKQHLFNAAAVGVFILGLTGYGAATWWVATPWLFIPLVIAGSIVVLKIRRWELVTAFLLTGFIVFMYEEYIFGSFLSAVWPQFFLSYPALFLGFFMLTEPFSMPGTKRSQILYGVFVAFLSNTSLLKGIISMTPELALLIGNLAAYPTTLKQKLFLKCLTIKQIAKDTVEITFVKPSSFKYKAGQYLEWSVPHQKVDMRGMRRYFTIASAPTENVLRVALKIPENASSYKQKISNMQPGDTVIASQLAGDFVLPTHSTKKIAMVAGGIGVTPFRSHLQHLADTNDNRNVVLFYANNTIPEVAYGNLFSEIGHKISLKIVYIFAREPQSSEYETGYFSREIVEKQTPDYLDRHWYISGPPPMVNATEKALRSLGIPRRNIVKDFFPGLA